MGLVYRRSPHCKSKSKNSCNGRGPITIHRYSNEAERDNQDIYDDFKLKKPFGLLVYTEIFQG